MGVFAGLGKAAAPFGQGNYITDGKYLIQLVAVKQAVSQKGEGPFVAVEGVVLDTLVAYEKSNQEGASVTWIVMLNKQPALSNLKGFFGAACGFHPESRFAYIGGTVTRENVRDGNAVVSMITKLEGGQLAPIAPGDDWPTNHNGQPAEDVTDYAWEQAAINATAGAGTALAGIELIAEARTVPTKKGGNYTRVTWSTPDEPATS